MVNMVSSLLCSSILTCQYPDFRSSDENYLEPCRPSRVSWMQGSEQASLTVQLFSFLRSIQNHRPSSFFWTRSNALAHGLCDFWMAPISNIPWRWAFTSLYMWGGFAGSTLWRASSWSIWSSVWWRMCFLGPGHNGQTGVPIWPAASWPDLVPPWGHSSRLWRLNSSRTSSFWRP